MKLTRLRLFALVLTVAVAYFAAAELGLSMAFVHTNVTPVWPPTAIAIASLLIFGPRLWPAVFLGAFAANFPTHIPLGSAVGIATGNTLEALFAYSLITRRLSAREWLQSVRDLGRFILFAAVFAPVVSATIGNLSLCLGGAATWSNFSSLWLTWWLGDSFGALIFCPFLLAWSSNKRVTFRSLTEVATLFLVLFVLSMVIFGGWFPGPRKTYPLAYLCLPLLLWAALRFEQRFVTSGVMLLAVLAVWGAVHGYGPFLQPSPNVSLLLLLSFLGTSTLMTLVLFAVITERRNVESERRTLTHELDLQKRRIEDLVAHVPGVVWEAWGQPDARNMRIAFVNNYVEKMLGYSVDEWLSSSNFWLAVVHPEDKERAAKEAVSIFASGKGGTSRFRWLHKDGREIWVEAQSIVVTDPNGMPVGMRGVTMDITAAVRAETERADLLRRESAARAQAEEASRLKDEFLATVSHELRTPLNAVVGWARLLRGGQLDQEGIGHAVDVIDRNAAAQKQIIEDLLDVSRIITGKLRVNSQRVDVLLVIHSAIDVIRPAADAKELRIRTHIAVPDIVVRGDFDRLQQVMWNTLANAVKFTPFGGVIDIYLTKCGSYAEIRTQDNGPGIPVEFLPHIFERFSQADGSSTRSHGGLGLGLAIVRHLVELHGGTVVARNKEDGDGAILIVRLPAVEPLPAEVVGRQIS
ncbi:MAG: MASE1 domain-containing protein [Pyrinomonadaceae bacterium]